MLVVFLMVWYGLVDLVEIKVGELVLIYVGIGGVGMVVV